MTTATIEKTITAQPKVGDILISSWGYDQTNIEFFKVVKVSDFSVWIQQLNNKIVEVTGWAHEKVVASDSSEYQVRNWDVPGEYITKTYPIHRHKVKQFSWNDENSYYVSLNSFSFAKKWDGKPREASHTH